MYKKWNYNTDTYLYVFKYFYNLKIILLTPNNFKNKIINFIVLKYPPPTATNLEEPNGSLLFDLWLKFRSSCWRGVCGPWVQVLEIFWWLHCCGRYFSKPLDLEHLAVEAVGFLFVKSKRGLCRYSLLPSNFPFSSSTDRGENIVLLLRFCFFLTRLVIHQKKYCLCNSNTPIDSGVRESDGRGGSEWREGGGKDGGGGEVEWRNGE